MPEELEEVTIQETTPLLDTEDEDPVLEDDPLGEADSEVDTAPTGPAPKNDEVPH